MRKFVKIHQRTVIETHQHTRNSKNDDQGFVDGRRGKRTGIKASRALTGVGDRLSTSSDYRTFPKLLPESRGLLTSRAKAAARPCVPVPRWWTDGASRFAQRERERTGRGGWFLD